ncbi:tRNA (adenosine(37)-N6)-dimethylallyltransferase MiaA [Microterricola pindariensis]|uniref:tRNA dimethylallyltransferase n=1 Tax=Microterricola pindariensis TaxID=478010 RepID=A0ABX5AX87_9MICO|nr:tRNA (adenosine(37)-N6)-dimethylallyltransferase MiaA [Microterricola pindariensis]PPL19271.1 tRNA (adenosine(37)-N6)-dimethylallyltransferase MiaA [Microterricola pindariensis]
MRPGRPGADPAALIAVVGATGTGKSALSLDIAERLAADGIAAEIVNADAMQLYRGMDIGTAKLPPAERRGIPHHMFDVLGVRDEAAVAGYQEQARAVVDDIRARGAVPIVVGGSGLYVSAVVYDFRFPGTDPVIRAALEAELVELGPGLLYRRLAAFDQATALRVGSTNGRRIVRALEVIAITGEPNAAALPDEPEPWRPLAVIGLAAEREQLTARLDRRVEQMWADGLLDEVRALLPLGLEEGVTASRAIGYTQAIDEIHGRSTRAEAIEATQQLTRRYARRQVSWFKRYPHAHWLPAATEQDGSDAGAARVDAALSAWRAAGAAPVDAGRSAPAV